MLCPFMAMLCVFLGTPCAFLGTLHPFLGMLCAFVAILCAFFGMLCVFVAMLCAFFGMLCAFAAMLCAFLGMLSLVEQSPELSRSLQRVCWEYVTALVGRSFDEDGLAGKCIVYVGPSRTVKRRPLKANRPPLSAVRSR